MSSKFFCKSFSTQFLHFIHSSTCDVVEPSEKGILHSRPFFKTRQTELYQEEGGIWRRSPTENTPKHYSAIHSSILLHSSESLMRINTNFPPTLSSSKVSDKLLLLLVRGIELKGLKITTKSDSTDFMWKNPKHVYIARKEWIKCWEILLIWGI